MSDQLNRIENLLGTLQEKIEQRFNQIEGRIEQIDGQIKQFDGQFEQIDSRFNHVEYRFDKMQAQFDNVHAQLDRIEKTQNDDTVAILKLLQTKISDLNHTTEYTLKEQTMIKLELDKIKSKLPSMSINHLNILDQI